MKLHTEPTVLWIVGEPGLGKTTLVRRILGEELTFNEKPKWSFGREGRVSAAGWYSGGTFDGADTVPYNAVNEALSYWTSDVLPKSPLTVLDGDRFSIEPAWRFFRDHEAKPRTATVLLAAPSEIGAARRAARSTTVQNATWVRGRVTKARGFFERNPDAIELDATRSPEEVFASLKAFLETPPRAAPDPSEVGVLGMFE